jgi:hypothetical protein
MSTEIRDYLSEFDFVERRSSDIVYLLPAICAALYVEYVYLQTHAYPAFGAGLFLLMAEQISQHGYGLPATIPLYAEPVPFAYPPLMFYVVAVIRDLTGVAPLTISRFLPGVVTTAYLVPFYLFVRELLRSSREAGLATFVLALSPSVLEWHISAGGVVRAPAMLFVISGLFAGLMLFRTRRRRWLAASVVLFTLTLLTHPTYTVFFGLSYLWMYLALDRTAYGLAAGATVAVGGVVLSSPWWGQVLATHGLDVFAGAAGTHGGIGAQVGAAESSGSATEAAGVFSPVLLVEFVSGVVSDVRPWLAHLDALQTALFGGWFVCLVGATVSATVWDEYRPSDVTTFLLGWFALSAVVFDQHRFAFLVGTIAGAVAVYEYVLPLAGRTLWPKVGRRHLEVGMLLVVAVGCLSVGGLFAGSALDSHGGSASLPAFIDDDDVEAMAWAEENTAESADFLVLGDAAEWFPQYTDRSIVVGPWGMEWRGHDVYRTQLGQFVELSDCDSGLCLTEGIDEAGIAPDYVYVPKDEYTVRGIEHQMPSEVRTELGHAEDYTLVYENDGVMIFERQTDATGGAFDSDGDTDRVTRTGTTSADDSGRTASSTAITSR